MKKEVEKLLSLHELDDRRQTLDEVKEVIAKCPAALSFRKDGELPVEAAAGCPFAVSFVPLLAKEGCRRYYSDSRLDDSNVNAHAHVNYTGGDMMNEDRNDNGNMHVTRGGLLCTLGGSTNVLQDLSNLHMSDAVLDGKYRDVLEQLRDLKLLQRSDIQTYDLLYWASSPSPSQNQERFQFYLQWDPDALWRSMKSGLRSGIELGSDNSRKKPCLLYRIDTMAVEKEDIQWEMDRFELILAAGMKHFPRQLGFLFRRHRNQTACERAFQLFGDHETMSIIRKCIPPGHIPAPIPAPTPAPNNCEHGHETDCDEYGYKQQSYQYPILHYVAKNAPALMEIFVRYYPYATYMRDHHGRTLFQAQLSSGHKTFASDASFFMNASDEQAEEMDPMTGLYPFMVAAASAAARAISITATATNNVATKALESSKLRKSNCDIDAVYMLLMRNPKMAC